MLDRWLIFVILQFVSAAIGFTWGILRHAYAWVYIGGFFFSLGVFAMTRWGYDKWKEKQKPKRRR